MEQERKAQEYLISKGHDDIVHNAKQYPTNTPENADKWVYTSDLLADFTKELEAEHRKRIDHALEANNELVKEIGKLKADLEIQVEFKNNAYAVYEKQKKYWDHIKLENERLKIDLTISEIEITSLKSELAKMKDALKENQEVITEACEHILLGGARFGKAYIANLWKRNQELLTSTNETKNNEQ